MTSITDGTDVWLQGPTPRLMGGQCASCGTVAFPRPDGCGRCAGGDLADHELQPEGPLWTFTIQHIEPKPPYFAGSKPFVPFALGYVSLGGEVLVEGRILTDRPEGLVIGMPMRTVAIPLGTDADGTTRSTFGFAPAGGVG